MASWEWKALNDEQRAVYISSNDAARDTFMMAYDRGNLPAENRMENEIAHQDQDQDADFLADFLDFVNPENPENPENLNEADFDFGSESDEVS